MDDVVQRLRADSVDRYEVQHEIGRGGMAVVYLARDIRHDSRVAPIVAPSGESPSPVPATVVERRWSWRWAMQAAVGLALVVVFAVAAIVLWRAPPNEPATSPRSVAVLPLRAIGSPALQSAADAVTEELTTALALDTSIVVRFIPRAWDIVRGGGDADLSRRRLGAAYVVEGGVQRAGGMLRVTVRLLRTADAVSVWAGSYDVEGVELMMAARRVATEAAIAIVRDSR